MLCPDCKNLMVVIEFKDVETDWCPQCEGYWLDKGELELILESDGLSTEFLKNLAQPSLNYGKRKCPICSKIMQLSQIQLNDSVLEVDVCSEHGIWFDKGELQSVLHFAAQISKQV